MNPEELEELLRDLINQISTISEDWESISGGYLGEHDNLGNEFYRLVRRSQELSEQSAQVGECINALPLGQNPKEFKEQLKELREQLINEFEEIRHLFENEFDSIQQSLSYHGVSYEETWNWCRENVNKFQIESRAFSAWFNRKYESLNNLRIEKERLTERFLNLIQESSLLWHPDNVNNMESPFYQKALGQTREELKRYYSYTQDSNLNIITWFNSALEQNYRRIVANEELQDLVEDAQEKYDDLQQLIEIFNGRRSEFEETFSSVEGSLNWPENLNEGTLFSFLKRLSRENLPPEMLRQVKDAVETLRSYQKLLTKIQEQTKVLLSESSRLRVHSRITPNIDNRNVAEHEAWLFVLGRIDTYDSDKADFINWFSSKRKWILQNLNRAGRRATPESQLGADYSTINNILDRVQSGVLEGENSDLMIFQSIDLIREWAQQDNDRRLYRSRMREPNQICSAKMIILKYVDLLETFGLEERDETIQRLTEQLREEPFSLRIDQSILMRFWTTSCCPSIEAFLIDQGIVEPKNAILTHLDQIRNWARQDESNELRNCVFSFDEQTSYTAQFVILEFLERLEKLRRYDFRRVRKRLARKLNISVLELNDFWRRSCSSAIRKFLHDRDYI